MSQTQLPQERKIYQFLSIYRFFTYALAVGLTLLLPSTAPILPPLYLYLTFGLLAIYTIFKMFAPFRLYQRYAWSYVLLGGDLVVCLLLVLLTGGLRSGLLLYSLAPIITAALLFEQSVSLVLAALSILPLALAHSVLSRSQGSFVWILEGNWLSMLIIYAAVCFLSGTIPYRTNMNIYRRIESNTIFQERKRLAREVHDGMAQALGYFNLGAQRIKEAVSSQNTEEALRQLHDLTRDIADTYQDVRESIDYLNLESRPRFSLIPSLAEYLREFQQRTGIATELTVPEGEAHLSPVAELELLRIAQEALTNVRKHSGATKVRVSLKTSPDAVEMVVRDDGKDFPPEYLEGKAGQGQHGLNIMRERAESLGGTLTITSAPGQGAEVKAVFPPRGVRL